MGEITKVTRSQRCTTTFSLFTHSRVECYTNCMTTSFVITLAAFHFHFINFQECCMTRFTLARSTAQPLRSIIWRFQKMKPRKETIGIHWNSTTDITTTNSDSNWSCSLPTESPLKISYYDGKNIRH